MRATDKHTLNWLRRRRVILAGINGLLLALGPRLQATETSAGRRLCVGPAEELKTPSAAAAVAQDGDTIEVQPGKYPGDVAVWIANRLTIRGVNGVVHLEAKGRSAQQKAIWVIRGEGTTVENIEFSDCHVPDHNGAGIRQEGGGLVVRHCSFHDNDDGILAGANPESDILVESSEFYRNGFGDGLSHNLYIGRVHRFTLQFCSSHHARVGHLVKSRAQTNLILYNRLMDEQDGSSSYVIDLPNGGRSIIIGNLIQHGARAKNGTAVSYAAEGAKNTSQELYFVNNTLVNEHTPSGAFLRVAGASPRVRVINNLVTGGGRLLVGPGETVNNLILDQPGFVDRSHYDYRLGQGSPAIGAGVDPGEAGDFNLTPVFYYRHALGADPRPKGARLNIGACPQLAGEKGGTRGWQR